jgi:hypothetical protein
LALFLAIFSLIVPMAGCSQAQIVQVIDTLDQQIPQIAQMATGLTLLVAPEYAPAIGPAAALIAADGKLLESLIAGYNPAVPNPTVLQKINAAWLDIQTNLQSIVSTVGIKDAKTAGIVNGFAGLIGLIAQNIVILVNQQPAAVALNLQTQLPAIYGWHISGTDMIAIEGTPAGQVIKTSVKPKFSARDIAKHWNKLCSTQEKAKIAVPKAKILGISIPFTGKK